MRHSKQLLNLISAAVLLLTVTGCDVKKELETIVEQGKSFGSIVPESQDGMILCETDTYTVSLLHLDTHESVYCAQISGLADTAVQDTINEYLRTMEQERFNTLRANEVYYDAKPQVHYAGENILSLTQKVKYWGKYGYTQLNFDLTTGEKIQITDIADTKMIAERIFNNEGITIVDGYEGASVLDFIEDGQKTSAESVQAYIELNRYHFNENEEIVIDLQTDTGLISVMVEE